MERMPMMSGVTEGLPPDAEADVVILLVDTGLYTVEAVFRTCYLLTDRCYLLLREEEGGRIAVEIRGKTGDEDLQALKGEFGNELINQRIRTSLAQETQAIRELIVAQAFAEADLGSD